MAKLLYIESFPQEKTGPDQLKSARTFVAAYQEEPPERPPLKTLESLGNQPSPFSIGATIESQSYAILQGPSPYGLDRRRLGNLFIGRN